MVVNNMNHLEQMAWQKEVILEEFYDSLAERNRGNEGLDEEAIEELLMQKRKLQ